MGRIDVTDLIISEAMNAATTRELREQVAEQAATISRLQDLVAKFQRGETSTLYAEGKV